MADVMVRIRKELDARIEQLRPLAEEFERLQRAAAALARSGVRAVPGLGPGPSASRDPMATSSERAERSKPAGQRRATVPPRTPASAAQAERGSTGPAPPARPAARRRGSAARRVPAARSDAGECPRRAVRGARQQHRGDRHGGRDPGQHRIGDDLQAGHAGARATSRRRRTAAVSAMTSPARGGSLLRRRGSAGGLLGLRSSARPSWRRQTTASRLRTRSKSRISTKPGISASSTAAGLHGDQQRGGVFR